jgi:uncharacterized protein (DUF2147 family)
MNRSLALSVLSVLLLLVGSTRTVSAQQKSAEADGILGVWLTEEGTSKIEIYKCGEAEYCGKISWLKEPEANGKPRVDDKNPDESLRARPLQELVILRGFVYDEDNVWRGGKIYDPKSGNDYTAKITLVDANNLDLRGYVLIPLFGRTSKWTRVP